MALQTKTYRTFIDDDNGEEIKVEYSITQKNAKEAFLIKASITGLIGGSIDSLNDDKDDKGDTTPFILKLIAKVLSNSSPEQLFDLQMRVIKGVRIKIGDNSKFKSISESNFDELFAGHDDLAHILFMEALILNFEKQITNGAVKKFITHKMEGFSQN